MKKDWKYIIYFSVFIAIYVAVQLISPKKHSWSITLSHQDKDPYGTYALSELIPALFELTEHNNKTFYELLDSSSTNAGLISFSTSLNLGDEDTEKLLNYVAKGETVFLSAHYFDGKLADTLNLSTIDYLFDNNDNIDQRDSISLHFVNPSFDTLAWYTYRRDNVHNYFDSYDSLKTTIISRNDLDKPVTLRIAIGDGSLIINSTPLAFTNINLLNHKNHFFASQSLSYLEKEKLIWTEFYHLGRMEASTPLRFILTQEPLAWAYYIIIISILLLILFESKRKQRIIPILPPLQNTTLEFATTIGNLYYQRGDHKNIAEKKIIHFFELLNSRYNLAPYAQKDLVYIAKKTGNDELETFDLFNLITSIQKKNEITSDELITLNKKIERFIKF